MATNSSILPWKFSMDRGSWQATLLGVTKSWTQLSTHAHFISMEVFILMDYLI